MILDRALEVSTAQVVTATAVSTNSIDLSSAATAGHGAAVGSNPHSIGTGTRVPLVIDVTTAFTTGDSAVLQFEIITATDALLTTRIEIIGRSDTYTAAALTVDREPIVVHMNADPGNSQGHNQRFLGARFTVTVGSFSAGAVTAGFQLDFQDARIFPASTST